MDSLKIYLCGSLNAKSEIRVLANAIKDDFDNSSKLYKVQFTCSWLYEDGISKNQMQAAETDRLDLLRADVVVHCFPQIRSSGGGADTELGIALTSGIQVIVFGQRINVFHHLPEVGHIQDDVFLLFADLDLVAVGKEAARNG